MAYRKKSKKRIVFDFSRLLGKIIECYGTRQGFAAAIGLTATTVSNKLDGDASWTQEEIITACDLLGIAYSDIPFYFFVKRVAISQPL